MVKKEKEVPKFPTYAVWVIVALCTMPLILNVLGIDFGSKSKPINWETIANVSDSERIDFLFYNLSGAFTHTLLEWSAFITALATAILAFIHYGVKKNPVVPVIGMALLCSGCMDAFHTLAATRLISANAPNTNFIPFTWAICRLFNALIMIGGIVIVTSFAKPSISKKRPGLLIGVLCISFLIISYIVIEICARRYTLPQTMYPDSFITRPWDVGPLILFILAGLFIYPKLTKNFPGVFSLSILVSVLPGIAVQAYMVFGSTALFDNNFNIAHFLKIISYIVPFYGLGLDYLYTYRSEVITKEKLHVINKEIQESQESLVQSEKMRALGTLAAGVAHELNNPMMGILNYSQYCIKHTDKNNRCYKVMVDSEREILRCIDIVNNLLTFSRKDNDNLHKFKITSCHDIMQRVFKLLSFRIEKENIQIELDYNEKSLPDIMALDTQIQQVFLNLVSNSFDAMEKEETKILKINIVHEETVVKIEIIDSGIGIPVRKQSTIFEPFFTTKPTGKGTGLGLSIVHGIIKLHGGSIEFVSEEGMGTTFTIKLPIIQKRFNKRKEEALV